MSFCLSACVSANQSLCLSVCLSVRPSVRPSSIYFYLSLAGNSLKSLTLGMAHLTYYLLHLQKPGVPYLTIFQPSPHTSTRVKNHALNLKSDILSFLIRASWSGKSNHPGTSSVRLSNLVGLRQCFRQDSLLIIPPPHLNNIHPNSYSVPSWYSGSQTWASLDPSPFGYPPLICRSARE